MCKICEICDSFRGFHSITPKDMAQLNDFMTRIDLSVLNDNVDAAVSCTAYVRLKVPLTLPNVRIFNKNLRSLLIFMP